MNKPSKNLRLQALVGLVGGAVVLVIITAILTSAVASTRAADRLPEVVSQLQALADQQDATAKRLAEQQRIDAQQRTGTLEARRRILHDNAELQRQLRALAKYLRSHGINVPRSITTPRAEPSTRPKVRRHPTSPATPTPTAPSPSTPTDPYCVLVPALCSGLPQLPTALPSLLP